MLPIGSSPPAPSQRAADTNARTHAKQARQGLFHRVLPQAAAQPKHVAHQTPAPILSFRSWESAEASEVQRGGQVRRVGYLVRGIVVRCPRPISRELQQLNGAIKELQKLGGKPETLVLGCLSREVNKKQQPGETLRVLEAAIKAVPECDKILHFVQQLIRERSAALGDG
ncbi:hypothetical protein [Rugamonas aquatica]|uniref:Uncharacterized protein n=1 Tax=Rugamonas aquatica TaxID=2743357 RepID=A0A6A7N6G0_9BURK|nr:hypothetical protein [Rugamonas aquatica]MQA40715.1 hypothetical protein [Rugamonas aquatica]